MPILLVAFHLFLIGDAGLPDSTGEPVLEALVQAVQAVDPTGTESAVLVLGDNLYETGMPPANANDRREMTRRIDDQVQAIRKSGARGWFIPGNHDWHQQARDGCQRVRREEAFVDSAGLGTVHWIPDSGCPGPVIVDSLDPRLRLVVFDSEWWLRQDDWASSPQDSCCGGVSPESFQRDLTSAIRDAGGRRVIVAAHHPIRSRGPHGGHFTLLDHLFPLRNIKPWIWLPLPVVGSIYPLARAHGALPQDLSAPRYERLRAMLGDVFRAAPPWLYATGHDHTLQLLDGHAELGDEAPRWLLVSGAGIAGNTEPVDTDDTVAASSEAGFFRLDFADDGSVDWSMITVDSHGTGIVQATGHLTDTAP